MTIRRELGAYEWEDRYQKQPAESMPWFYPELDPDVEEGIKKRGIQSASILDIGCGAGTQAVALAQEGFQVTAIDFSTTALKIAREKARQSGLEIQLIQDDILEVKLEAQFDMALDRGCLHIMAPESRVQYSEAVYQLLKPKGLLFLKCLSHLETGEYRPYRFTLDQVTEIFCNLFSICYVKQTEYQRYKHPYPRVLPIQPGEPADKFFDFIGEAFLR